MRALITSPFILAPLLVIFIVYFYLLKKLSSQSRFSGIAGKTSIVFFILTTTNCIFLPLTYLAPSALGGFDKTIGSAIAQLSIYASLIYLAKGEYRRFIPNAVSSFIKCPVLGLLILFSILSAFWSETPWITFRSSLVLLGVSAFGAHIARRYAWHEMANFLRWTITLIIIGSVLLTPPTSFGNRWNGLLEHPIPFSGITALNTVLWASYAFANPDRRLTGIIFAVISGLATVIAGAATGLMIAIVLLSFVVMHQLLKSIKFKQAILLLVGYFALAIPTVLLLTTNAESILGAFGKDPTLTGRTDFWPQLIELIKQHALLGYGIHGFWQPWRGLSNPAVSIISPNQFIPPHAHNGFLEVGLQVGISGAILFGISLVSNLINSIQFILPKKMPEPALPFIFLGYTILFNFSHSVLLDGSYVWLLYVYITVRFLTDAHQVDAYHRHRLITVKTPYSTPL